MVIKVKHEPGKRLHKILSVLATLIPDGLTEMEIIIIAELKAHPELTAVTRKAICKSLDISSDYLGNYLKKLRDKKVLNDKNELHSLIRSITVESEDKPQLVPFMFEIQA